MENYVNPEGKRGMSGWTITAIACGGCFLFLITFGAIGAAVMFPVFAKAREAARKSACQSNLKEMALAVSMYATDNNDRLPCSTSAANDEAFETTLGSASSGGRATALASAVRPYRNNEDMFRCPSDSGNASVLSYHYKHAVNKASRNGLLQKDFTYPSEQAMLYERKSFHWGGGPLANDASCNVAFIDGHIKTHRLVGVSPDAEPKYFNTIDTANPKSAGMKKPYWDPRCCYDSLR